MGDVINMQQASETIAQFQPVKLELRDGTTATISELSWPQWREIWGDLREVIETGVTIWNAQRYERESGAFYVESTKAGVKKTSEGDEFAELDPEAVKAIATQASDLYRESKVTFNEMVTKAVGQLEHFPGMMEQLIKGSVSVGGEAVTSQWLEGRSHGEMLGMFRISLKLNFIENEEVLRFFAVARSIASKVTGDPGDQAETQQPPNEDKKN